MSLARDSSRTPMKNIYLHLGMPKTGTTFLQARCFPYLDRIRYRDKEIMDLLDRVIYTNPTFLDLKRTKDEADRILEKTGDESLLISHERLFGNMLINYHDNLYITRCLKMLFPEAKVIIVIRRQDDLVESIYKQSLQSYYHQRTNSFLNYRNNRFEDSCDLPGWPNIDIKQLNLRRYVQNYVEHFGRDNVAILPYELLTHDQRAFLEKLAAAINVEPFYPANNYQENRSYSWLSCRIALALNRFVRVEGDGSRLLRFIPNKPFSSFLKNKPSETGFYKMLSAINRRLTLRHFLQNGVDRIIYIKGNLISAKKRELILSFHTESNRTLDEEFDLDLKRFGYY